MITARLQRVHGSETPEPLPVRRSERTCEIRIASTPEERERIYRFRYPVYIEELGRRVSFADHARRCVRDDLDESAIHFYATHGEEIVGAMRWHLGTPPALPAYLRDAYRLNLFSDWPAMRLSFMSRLMIRREWRLSGVVHLIARQWWWEAARRGFLFNFSHCSPELTSFFERFGCRQLAAPFDEPEIGLRQPLILPHWDEATLQSLNSPLAGVVEAPPASDTAVTWLLNQIPSMSGT